MYTGVVALLFNLLLSLHHPLASESFVGAPTSGDNSTSGNYIVHCSAAGAGTTSTYDTPVEGGGSPSSNHVHGEHCFLCVCNAPKASAAPFALATSIVDLLALGRGTSPRPAAGQLASDLIRVLPSNPRAPPA